MKLSCASAIVVMLLLAKNVCSTEPNETFGTATVLSPGVMTVADSLTATAANFPDTLLGIRDHFGGIYYTDDESSPLGDSHASAAYGVDTNSGNIDFSITGYTDLNFDGSHSEFGSYEVFVDVYDFFGDPVDSFSEVRTLAPGVVHDFFFSDFEWFNGEYDVYIDNALDPISDIDFFTFTGLPSGAQFTAQTADPNTSNIDTVLGWFDSGGGLLDSDDDGGAGNLSLLEGVVPGDGMLTFAVSGFGDEDFTGSHLENGTYELRLALGSAGVPGDYNNNGAVDAGDYVLWRKGGPLANEVDTPGTVNAADYTAWRARFGNSGAGTGAGSSAPGSAGDSSAAVPEPASAVLLLLAALATAALRVRRVGRGHVVASLRDANWSATMPA